MLNQKFDEKFVDFTFSQRIIRGQSSISLPNPGRAMPAWLPEGSDKAIVSWPGGLT